MDLAAQVRITRELVDIDSTTGSEAEAGRYLARLLRGLGYELIEQPVSNGRFNVYAHTGTRPDVVFSTHFDCVPPYFPSREERGRVYGRGACDAKGVLVAQIAAAERLRASGEARIGLLFVVGEERGSDGATQANDLAPGARFLVNGEPTENRLGMATRGIYRLRLWAAGRAAHTSLPELGESAIEKLLDALVAMRAIEWPSDPTLGRTYYTVGLVRGGVAANVVPADAEAEVLFRTVGNHELVRAQLERHLAPLVSVEDIHVVPPVTLTTIPGMDTAVFSFATDIPFLDRWGAPLLYGPGSIGIAHTADEHVEIADLRRAVDDYVALATHLLHS